MKARIQAPIPNPPEVVFPLFLMPGRLFIGSATRVTDSCFLTCDHCLELYWRPSSREQRIETADGKVLTPRVKHPDFDLALLDASQPPHTAGSLVFFTQSLPKGTRVTIAGYPEEFDGRENVWYRDAPGGINGTFGSGELYDLQIDGGVANGLSGSAIFAWISDCWQCVAMADLGGRHSAKSRGIGGAILVNFLKSNGIVPIVGSSSPRAPIARLLTADRSGPVIQKVDADDSELEGPLLPEATKPSKEKLELFHLLDSRNRLIPFSGREESLEDLLKWARSEANGISVRFLTGPGGSGKSRLAREAAQILHEDGWIAGEIRLDRPRRTPISAEGLFAVIEEPEKWRTHVQWLLGELGRVYQTPARIRVLLVTRLPNGEWRNELDEEGLSEVSELRIGPIGKPQAVGLFFEAIDCFSGYFSGTPEPLPASAIENWLDEDPPMHCLPLLVIAAALHRVQTPDEELRRPGAKIIEALTDRERVRINNIAKDAGWKNHRAASRLAGLAAVSSEGLDEAAVRGLARRTEIGLPKHGLMEDIRALGFLRDWHVPAPRPDLVASEFLFTVLNDAGDQASEWLWEAIGDSPDIDRLGRLAYDIAKLRGRDAFETFTRWLASIVKESMDKANRWKPIIEQENPPAGLLPLAVAIGRKLSQDPAIIEEDQRAAILINLSNRLYELANYPEALDASNRAVAILRFKMQEKNAAQYELQYGNALRSNAACLCKDGQTAEAVQASCESRDIFVRLVRMNAALYEPFLVRSLRTHSNCLSASAADEGHATAIMRQAIEILTRLDKQDPGRYATEFARALDTLAVCYYQAGETANAVESVRKSIDIWRKLAQGSPARHEAGLALALIELSYYLRDADEGQATELLREAISIYSRVARANPAHEEGYARHLEELAYGLTDELIAVDALRNALEIRRKLALTRPEGAEPGLVTCLDRQLYRLDRRSHPEGAVQELKRMKIGAQTVCILLVSGESPDGQPIFAYVAVRLDKLEMFMEAQTRGIFYPEDYGVILDKGKGLPSSEVKLKMETEYGFNHEAMQVIQDGKVADQINDELAASGGERFRFLLRDMTD